MINASTVFHLGNALNAKVMQRQLIEDLITHLGLE
jgi:hypothetical protein